MKLETGVDLIDNILSQGVSQGTTVIPEVVFNFNQHQAHLILVFRKDIQLFNSYCNSALSQEEKEEVLGSVKLNTIC